MRNRILFSLLMLACIAPHLRGQSINVVEDSLVSQMMQRFVEINKSNNYVEGWRIQILSTTDRQRLESIKATFQYQYPDVPIDWVHHKPYYKLRAGAFASKLEAIHLQHLLQNDFPSAYPARDNMIRPRELLEQY